MSIESRFLTEAREAATDEPGLVTFGTVQDVRRALQALRLEVPDAVWVDFNARAEVALVELERLRGVHLDASEQPWSFHQGSLRERIEWCRVQHQLAAENPPLHPQTREAKADFDRACVVWYDEMLAQLDALEGGE